VQKVKSKHNNLKTSNQYMFGVICRLLGDEGEGIVRSSWKHETNDTQSGVSVDDITNEEQYTYIAIHRETWRPINPPGEIEGEEARDGTATAFRRTEEGIYAGAGGGSASAQYAPFWARSVSGTYEEPAGE
jgi:hypothetical protein